MGKRRKIIFPALLICFLLVLTGIYLQRSPGIGIARSKADIQTNSAEKRSVSMGPKSEAEQKPVNINTADLETLKTLPGIGAVRAQRILDYRNQNGPFEKLSDLTKVEGIGRAVYHDLQNLICLEDNNENTDH